VAVKFYWWRKHEYPEKTTDLSQVTDKLDQLSYRFKMQKHKHSVFLVMKPRETIMFYWQTFLLWTGIHSAPVDEEPDNVLPPVSINIF
jgi:hypothetical protein